MESKEPENHCCHHSHYGSALRYLAAGLGLMLVACGIGRCCQEDEIGSAEADKIRAEANWIEKHGSLPSPGN